MQGHRFNIWGGVGCVVAIPNTYLALAFTGVVSLLLGLVSAVYCGTYSTRSAARPV